MPDTRDQLHAHQFVADRLVSALVGGDPDVLDRPMRRSGVGGTIGLVLALVVTAGFGIYGLVAGGRGLEWQEPGSIIVERETGTRYLFLDDTLRPVLNYSSALLAVSDDRATVRIVSRASLAKVPHGRPIGIPGAPDALPDKDAMSGGPWLVCTARRGPVTAPSGQAGVVVSLDEGWPAEPVPEERAVLVSVGRETYLAWRDRRMRIRDQRTLVALGYRSVTPMSVSAAWLNALAAGPDLAAPQVTGRGEAGVPLDGKSTRVGQVFTVRMAGGTTEHYLMRRDGLVPITATHLALLLADQRIAQLNPDGPRPVNVAAVAPAAKATTASAEEHPRTPPRPVEGLDGAREVCVQLSFDRDQGGVGRLVTVPADRPAAARSTATDATRDSRLADRIQVPPGGGALVVGQSAPGVETGTVYLITDLGVKYPLAGGEVVDALGYAQSPRVPVPTTVLTMFTTGPALHPEAARTEGLSP
ncbi:type VII secretion protein EccB [Micromonospora sp. WMMA1363]|uniref:type VII secretion protein EccB n=1 Tax=Micromonospora sp. WMMA1363 TaxID=3053985 RepID=UPI00259CD85B|nr:type VII secretion protein EccB [Micromonospora sp. WMMA1363]MDM4721475.1 type VII secretion protein EccB [Micromonospora sp. WMMA1363]